MQLTVLKNVYMQVIMYEPIHVEYIVLLKSETMIW